MGVTVEGIQSSEAANHKQAFAKASVLIVLVPEPHVCPRAALTELSHSG